MKTFFSKTLLLTSIFTLFSAGVSVYAADMADGSKATEVTLENSGNLTYVVQKGDTLYGLSRKFNVKVDQLRAANGMSSDSVLKIGQKLIIPVSGTASTSSSNGAPAAQSSTAKTSSAGNSSSAKTNGSTAAAGSGTRKYDTYVVQKGDTFWRIAKTNAITVDELKKLNNLTDETTLKIGQKLKIPVTIVDTKNTSLPDIASSDPRNYSEKKGDSTLTWPVKNPVVTYTKGKVSGVQLSAKTDEAVTSIRAGTVMYCGNYRGYGQVVFVQSKTGHIYAYCGLGTIKVSKGQYVIFGDVIGTAGKDSITGASQITLMVFQKSSPMDPAKAPRG